MRSAAQSSAVDSPPPPPPPPPPPLSITPALVELTGPDEVVAVRPELNQSSTTTEAEPQTGKLTLWRWVNLARAKHEVGLGRRKRLASGARWAISCWRVVDAWRSVGGR
jgi:hypothetical protein